MRNSVVNTATAVTIEGGQKTTWIIVDKNA